MQKKNVVTSQAEQDGPKGVKKQFEKTFLVDGNRKAIFAVFAISCLLHKRGYQDDWDHINIPLFLYPDNRKEITIASSRKMLEVKVKEACLSPQHIKCHSLRICGRTAYANLPEGGSITAGFLG